MHVFKRIMLALGLLGIAVTSLSPAAVIAQSKTDVCSGLGIATGTPDGCAQPAGGGTVETLIKTAITILSLVVGIISVIMIIIGALKYITSAGDSNSINTAKNTILYAVIGLAIAASAQIIVRFVLTKLPT